MSGLTKYPDPPQEMVNDVMKLIEGFDSMRKAASALGFSVSFLSGVKKHRWHPSEKLAAFCGWKVDRVWNKIPLSDA